jgi:hypothetical protein
MSWRLRFLIVGRTVDGELGISKGAPAIARFLGRNGESQMAVDAAAAIGMVGVALTLSSGTGKRWASGEATDRRQDGGGEGRNDCADGHHCEES